MKLKISLIALLFAACTVSAQDTKVSSSFLDSGRIATYRHKLKKAEENLAESKEEIAKYTEMLYKEQISVIKSYMLTCEAEIEKFRAQKDLSSLFIKEREALMTIMRSEHDELAKEAESVLDHILRFITRLGTRK
ncbi:MAG TPA: hypothetical protein VLG44_04105 [Chlamydiales bacterium]|nr:hypothetical protein [Chlamydiales bacterium]